MLGPMYPAVFKALKFEKPGVKKKRKRRTKREIEADRRCQEMINTRLRQEQERAALARSHSKVVFPERAASEEPVQKPAQVLEPQNKPDINSQQEKLVNENPPPAPVPLPVVKDATSILKRKLRAECEEFLRSFPRRPPFIDTRVLVQEIDAGRYPSINRQAGLAPGTGPNAGKCPICKMDGPDLIKCNFCPRRVHISCARMKWTLRDPEPYDDFICTVCIQAVTQRRNRAERRHIERVKGVEAWPSEHVFMRLGSREGMFHVSLAKKGRGRR